MATTASLAQDQWRVTPKLTFNYGLRYDFETGLGDQIDSYWGAIQPRVGFAYSPSDKTVIRGGFGLFFDRNNMTFFLVTGNQKTIPGFIPGMTLPMIRNGAETGGWQLNLINAAAFLPSPLACQGIEPGRWVLSWCGRHGSQKHSHHRHSIRGNSCPDLVRRRALLEPAGWLATTTSFLMPIKAAWRSITN